jgi:hypothetical protein
MTNKKIGDLAALTGALAGTELLEVQTSAPASKSVTAQQIANLASGGAAVPVVIQVAASDETTPFNPTTAAVTFRAPYAFTLTGVRASLSAPSSSGLPTFDVKMGGTSVLSTLLTVDAGEKTSTTAATPAVISTSAIADDAELTVDITVGGVGAAGAKITLIGTKP